MNRTNNKQKQEVRVHQHVKERKTQKKIPVLKNVSVKRLLFVHLQIVFPEERVQRQPSRQYDNENPKQQLPQQHKQRMTVRLCDLPIYRAGIFLVLRKKKTAAEKKPRIVVLWSSNVSTHIY
jgi:hypothetical protein